VSALAKPEPEKSAVPPDEARNPGSSKTISVLNTVMAPESAAALIAALDTVVPYVRAILLGSRDGMPEIIAATLASDHYADCGGVMIRDLMNVRIFPESETQDGALGSLLLAEESALCLPLAVEGQLAIAVLVRAGGMPPFAPEEITIARLCSAASLATLVADQKMAPASERASTDSALRDYQLLKVILDHLPISLTVQDSSGQFILANAIAAADLAVSVERLIGCSPGDFLSESEARSRRNWEQGVIAGGRTITAEARVQDDEGERILLTSHTPVSITNNTLLISSSVDITMHKEVERKLTESAHIDNLTGLPDRVRIEQHVDGMIATEKAQPFALAFIDLDNFKHVNDYYSHAIGDALLMKFSDRIQAKLQPGDMLARISGDEFVLLVCGHANRESVEPVIERVLADVKQPFYIEGFEIFSSCSIGVSFYPAHGLNYEVLRRNADGAMYGAKGKAKGSAVYFDDGLGRAITVRMEAEQRLRLAIRDHRFVCAFQPKVDMHTHEVKGFETLVRWKDSDGEIHPPGQFIGLAIELGLINPITTFVLEETIRSIDRLDAAFGPGTSISINVGAKQASDLGFMRGLVETIKQSGCPERLIVELTEDAIVEKGIFQSEVLPMLRDIGVRISIDDFGTGYSSLSALADITADEIKIDRSFISRIHERPRSQSVLKAIESLAQSLGMSMVAEGVETPEELIYLQTASRIRLAQGYFFSKPIYLDDMRGAPTIGGRTDESRQSSGNGRVTGRMRAPARSA
jgi:cyclic di-GMP phosphodiesterase Gmr